MDFNPKITNLKNKTRLLTLDLPQSQSVTALVMVKVGSRYEVDRIAGLSHFLEHMVFKGTQKYPTSMDLSATVDGIGAEFNAFTSKEYTGFYVKSAAEHLDLSLDVLSQLIWHPLIDSREMEKEKGVIVEELNMREDIPMAKVGENFETLLYGKTPLGRDIVGFKETIKGMKRQDFLDYQKQWYRPERMILGIVGRLASQKNITGEADRYFGDKRAVDLNTSDPERIVTIQNDPSLNVEYKKTEQAHLCLGVRAYPRDHKDRYVISLMTVILGGNMSSRLFTEVREKRGLAYYIKSDNSTYFDNGYFVSQAGTDLAKATETIKVIVNEYAKIGRPKDKHLDKELARAKEFLKGKLALSLENSREVASLFVDDLLMEGKIRTPKEILAGVEKVTVADVCRVAKEIFVPEGLNLAVIGPFEDKAKFRKLLS